MTIHPTIRRQLTVMALAIALLALADYAAAGDALQTAEQQLNAQKENVKNIMKVIIVLGSIIGVGGVGWNVMVSRNMPALIAGGSGLLAAIICGAIIAGM
jgi:hypothetical protein